MSEHQPGDDATADIGGEAIGVQCTQAIMSPGPSATSELLAALAKAQGAFTEVKKNRTAEIKGETKTGKEYSYTYQYADLESITEATRSALCANGLSTFSTPIDGHTLRFHLAHTGGAMIVADFSIPDMGNGGRVSEKLRAFGGVMSYLRRYAKTAVLDLASGEDDRDASGADADDDDRPVVEHADMKAAKSVSELSRVMSRLPKDEKPKYVAYFNQRMEELKTQPQDGAGNGAEGESK